MREYNYEMMLAKYIKSKEYTAPERNWKSNTKHKKLCQLILKYSNSTNLPPDNIIEYIYKNKTSDSNKMLKQLNSEYGGTDGAKYQKIFKPF